VQEPALRGENSNPEEPTISELRVKALIPFNPPIIDLLAPLLIYLAPPRVTHHDRRLVLQEAMEANVANSSRSPHTP
jgi:hypothetical protein